MAYIVKPGVPLPQKILKKPPQHKEAKEFIGEKKKKKEKRLQGMTYDAASVPTAIIRSVPSRMGQVPQLFRLSTPNSKASGPISLRLGLFPSLHLF